jgi:glycosyltransferase involved in cell wall biosynthesis
LEKLKRENKYDWITFYGAIYDNEKISDISRKCILACYPGDAGLSVLHYMSLSLPVVVHGDLRKHMGPEVSYVENDINGIFFERYNQKSLEENLKKILNDKDKLLEMQKNAFERYKLIVDPSLSERLLKIIEESA